MRKLRLREMEWLLYGYVVGEWLTRDLNLGFSSVNPELMFLISMQLGPASLMRVEMHPPPNSPSIRHRRPMVRRNMQTVLGVE